MIFMNLGRGVTTESHLKAVCGKEGNTYIQLSLQAAELRPQGTTCPIVQQQNSLTQLANTNRLAKQRAPLFVQGESPGVLGERVLQ